MVCVGATLRALTVLSSARRLSAESEVVAQKIQAEEELRALEASEKSARAYAEHPALLRLRELDTMQALAKNANARIYIGFAKHQAENEKTD